ncbi:MAG: hypothetical protein KDK51_09490 [Deltaproteobacteria bacterium]|nr:hypothetical protein [Deltaproteobacteria bacterium]
MKKCSFVFLAGLFCFGAAFADDENCKVEKMTVKNTWIDTVHSFQKFNVADYCDCISMANAVANKDGYTLPEVDVHYSVPSMVADLDNSSATTTVTTTETGKNIVYTVRVTYSEDGEKNQCYFGPLVANYDVVQCEIN